MMEVICQRIDAIPRDVSRTELADRLKPVLKDVAELDPVEREACLQRMRCRFTLRREEVDAYRKVLGQLTDELTAKSNVKPPDRPPFGTEEYERWENRPEFVDSRRQWGKPVYEEDYERARTAVQQALPPHKSGGAIWRTDHGPWEWRTHLIDPFGEPWEVDIHSDPNVGKSQLILQRVAADILGQDWIGIPTVHRPDNPRRWALVMIEMSERSWKRRMKTLIPGLTAELMDQHCPIVFTSDNAPNFTRPGAAEEFAELLMGNEITDVAIDPKRFAWPGWEFNSGPNPSEIVRHLRLFKTYGGARTLWVSSHDRKTASTGRAGGDGDQMSGDAAFWAASDATIRLVERNGLVEFRHHKSREGPKLPTIHLRRHPDTGILIPTDPPETSSTGKEQRLEALRRVLQRRRMSAREMADLVGVGRKTVTDEYLPILKPTVHGRGPGTTYSLSADGGAPIGGSADSMQLESS